MKCRECSSCCRGVWASEPETYVCLGADRQFAIVDRDAECVAYLYSNAPTEEECWYCNNIQLLYGAFRGRGRHCSMNTYNKVAFNYCPMCGKKLTKENEQ
jgi:hypothetical protein